jgi:hypothetical protein
MAGVGSGIIQPLPALKSLLKLQDDHFLVMCGSLHITKSGFLLQVHTGDAVWKCPKSSEELT